MRHRFRRDTCGARQLEEVEVLVYNRETRLEYGETVNLGSKNEKQHPFISLLLGGFIIAVVGFSDFATGHQLALCLFYTIAVSYIAWKLNTQAGIAASVVSACLWLLADLFSGPPCSHPLIPYWNALIRLLFFVVTSLLSVALRTALEREKNFSRLDVLTGAINPWLFSELLQMEIERLRRYNHVFTLAYIDLDNFKAVNDQYGHLVGNQALRTVVENVKSNIRKVDVIARLGGDEFALLMPESGWPPSVEQFRHRLIRRPSANARAGSGGRWLVL